MVEVLEDRSLLSTFLYVNNNGSPNTVSAYQVEANGDLTALPGGPMATGGSGGVFLDPQAITFDPVGGHLYATNYNSNTVTGFTIQVDGSLTALAGGPVPTPAGPVAVVADPLGRFLYVACASGGAVAVYEIEQPTGALTQVATAPVARANTLSVTPSGDFLYAAQAGNTKQLFGFQVAADGSLTAVPGSPVTGPGGVAGSAVTPNGAFLYVADSNAGRLYGYAIDPGTGQLTALAGMPLSNGVYGSAVVSPAGDLLYVSDSNGRMLAYQIAASGALTPVPGSPFARLPGTVNGLAPAVSPDGLHLYVVNTNTSNISVYDIAASGALTAHPGAPYARGSGAANSLVIVEAAATAVAADSLTIDFATGDQTITLTATVTSPRGALAGGTVTFAVAGGGSVTSSSVVNGIVSASLVVPGGTAAGTYVITATYSGTGIFDASVGVAALTINPAAVVIVPIAPAPPAPPLPLVVPPPVRPVVVVGVDAGGLPAVIVIDPATGQPTASFLVFDPAFRGGVRVAIGDVTGDGIPDIVAGAGPGGGPQVRVFDGRTYQPLGGALGSFFGLDSGFSGGVYVAVGDANGDGHGDVIVGADAGGGPQVAIYSGKDGTLLQSYYALPWNFTGGARVAAGDMDGDGFADVIVGAGRGAGPQVTVYSGRTGAILSSFHAMPAGYRGGVFVAAGDVDGDGRTDIVTGAGAGGLPQVSTYDGGGRALQSFFASNLTATDVANMNGNERTGVRVGTLTSAGRANIVTSPGQGPAARTNVYSGQTLALLDSFFALDPSYRGGLFVAGYC